MAVINNKKGGNALVRVTGTTTIALSDLQVSGETVTAASIVGICWSTNGNITIARGANTVVALHNAGQWDLSKCGGALGEDKTATIVITVTTGGTCLLEVSKVSSITGLEQP